MNDPFRETNRKRLRIFLAVTSLAISALILFVFFLSPLKGWDRLINDGLIRLRHKLEPEGSNMRTCINIIIDDGLMAERSQSVWNWDVYGEVISALDEHKPSIIACDVVIREALPEPYFAARNRKLEDAAGRSGRVFFPVILRKALDPGSIKAPHGLVWKIAERNEGSPPVMNYAVIPFPALLARSAGSGCINLNPDPDGITRKYPMLYRYEDGFIPSYALVLVCAYTSVTLEKIEIVWGDHILLRGARFYGGFVQDVRIPIDSRGFTGVNYRGPWSGSNASVNARELLAPYKDQGREDLLHAAITGSIAFISDLTTANRDYTPGIFESVYPSVGTITTVVQSILSGDFTYDYSLFDALFTCLVVVSSLWFTGFRRTKRGFAAGALAGVLLLSASSFFFFFALNKTIACSGAAIALFSGIAAVYLYRKTESAKNTIDLLERRVSERTALLESTNSRLEESLARLGEAAKQKELAMRKMENAMEQKTMFFHNLAHETKTPLTLIKNYLERYARRTAKSEELEIIRRNIARPCEDVLNFFDREKIERGEFPYDHDKTTDFSGLLKDRIALFLTAARMKSVEIEGSVKEGLFCSGDPQAIDRIIINLLDNAVKYTQLDSVIRVSLKESDGKIEFAVENPSPGFSEEQKANIFKPYYQLSYKKKSSQGMGLGLPIVKEILCQAGGTIEMECLPGCKVRFVVRVQSAARPAPISSSNALSAPVIHSVIEETPEDVLLDGKISKALSSAPEKSLVSLLDSYDLTKREREIIRLLHMGLQYKEISSSLNISIAAVRKRAHSIYEKFKVQNRTALFLAIEKKTR